MTTAILAAPGDGVHVHVERLIEICTGLRDVLKQEVDAVRSRAPDRIKALAPRKDVLALAYADELEAVRGARDALATLDPTLKSRFRQTMDAFRAAVEENARALWLAKTANEKLIQAVSEAVARKARPQTAYSRTGTYDGSGAPQSTAVPIALNQQV